jgi:hypothetical protein
MPPLSDLLSEMSSKIFEFKIFGEKKTGGLPKTTENYDGLRAFRGVVKSGKRDLGNFVGMGD